MVTFTARRSKPELAAPARPTPHEYKALSDIDDQQGLRVYTPAIHFFRRSCMAAKNGEPYDPAMAIKAALAKALVYYNSMAGRLRELPGGKLVVDCTGEGVVFVEADADVRIEEFGEPIMPPYPCVDQLLCEPGGMETVVGSPLIFMQVTRLKCGGFTVGVHGCHSIADGFGMLQFLTAIAELARGEAAPTVLPVWKRELLMARTPPLVTHPHPEYDPLPNEGDVMLTTPPECMVDRPFIFGPREIAALQEQVPLRQRSSSVFELVIAAAWRCRTSALGYMSGHTVRLMFVSNARGSWKRSPPLPRGFYGNALLLCVVASTAGELCGKPLGYAIELMCAAKVAARTDEYMQSVADLMALRGRPHFSTVRTYTVSDATQIEHGTMNFGRWAERVGGGPAVTAYMRCKNGMGEDGVVLVVRLPRPAMERFISEMETLLTHAGKKPVRSCL